MISSSSALSMSPLLSGTSSPVRCLGVLCLRGSKTTVRQSLRHRGAASKKITLHRITVVWWIRANTMLRISGHWRAVLSFKSCSEKTNLLLQASYQRFIIILSSATSGQQSDSCNGFEHPLPCQFRFVLTDASRLGAQGACWLLSITLDVRRGQPPLAQG